MSDNAIREIKKWCRVSHKASEYTGSTYSHITEETRKVIDP